MLLEINTSFFARHLGNGSADLFKADMMEHVSAALTELRISYRERVFSPFAVLYAFLSQVFNDDSSCRRAVLEVAQIRKAHRKKACSTATGGYCQAKKRLPLVLIEYLVRILAARIAVGEKSPWRQGRVLVVDGTGFSMPDTRANAKEFVRHGAGTHKFKKKGQRKPEKKEAVAFPVWRLVGVFSLATGSLIDLAISTWKGKGSGETSLLKKLWPCFRANDTLLGDGLYSSYPIIAEAIRLRCHVVSEFKKRSCWCIKEKCRDQIITIPRAAYQASGCSSRAEYEALTTYIKVRIVKLVCAPAGFRPKIKFIVTTHLDADVVTAEDLCSLYKSRWQVELNFRSIKTVLGMDVLGGKSPAMVHKEVWMHMLAYNLIREQMVAVGAEKKCLATDVSFRASQQAFAIARLLNACGINVDQSDLTGALLTEMVGKRPNRYEPRTIKRRQKGYKLMTESRKTAKTKLHKRAKK